jgi:alpha-tubulin suppressor-like RCC1 family protein
MQARFGFGAVLLMVLGLLSACDPPGSVIVGTVAIADATVAPNIEIAVLPDTTTTTPTAVTTTNAGGGFAFLADQVPDGSYVIQIDGRWWTGTDLSAEPADATIVTVAAAGPRVTINAQIDAAATISGALANPDTTPVADRLIIVRTPTDDPVTIATTGTDGSFVLRLRVPGDYRLAMYDPQNETFEPIGVPTYALAQGQVLDLGTLVVGLPTASATAIASGYTHTCALRIEGTVACWGNNAAGQLGDGTATDSLTPVAVTDITGAVSVAAGESHTCAVRSDATVACWGGNDYWQLGNGTNTNSLIPKQVSGITDAVSVAAGKLHTCVVRSGGTVSCWGRNFSGQLGNGLSNTNAPTPVQVTGITDAIAVAAGESHTCAVRSNGTVSCWGYNGDGQLGNGTTTSSSTPVEVSGITDATGVAAGPSHTCATHTDGTVSCWGYNSYGQLGNGTTTTSSTPVAVTGITNAVAITVGTYHTCATRTDGRVSCWGYNGAGQLGNGSNATRVTTAVEVTGTTDAVTIAAGNYDTCATHTDGTVSCWGYNANGELGDGTTDYSNVPVAVVGIP